MTDERRLTEIVCIIDRSGSMHAIHADAIGGFNAFLEAQKQLPGRARLTLVLFDDAMELLYDGVDIMDARPLDGTTFVPRGSTALLDAIGSTLKGVKRRLARLPEEEQPDAVVVAILTDGEENASRKFSRKQIFTRISKRRAKLGWEFVFLAANQDAIVEGARIGIPQDGTMLFSADSNGTRKAFDQMTILVSGTRVSDKPH